MIFHSTIITIILIKQSKTQQMKMTSFTNHRESSPNQTNRQQDSNGHYQKILTDFVPPSHRYVQDEKFTSAFFRDNNEEEYVIQRAFKANNFTSLRDLPDNISRNCILQQRYEKVKQQIYDESLKRTKTPFQIEQARNNKINENKKIKIGTLGYFQAFTYKQSDYQLPKKLANQQRLQNIEKRKQVNDRDFIPSGFDRKMKYEDPFRYVDRATPSKQNQKYLFPFHLPEDTFDVFKQDERRRKIVQQQLRVAGQFLPSKAQKSLSAVTKSKIPQILNQLQFYLKKFLKDQYGYFIGVNKRDHIEILFESKYLNDAKINMVMSGMCEHQILSKFCLRRNYKKWGAINSTTNYLQFVVFPPWVKQTQQLNKPITPASKDGNRT